MGRDRDVLLSISFPLFWSWYPFWVCFKGTAQGRLPAWSSFGGVEPICPLQAPSVQVPQRPIRTTNEGLTKRKKATTTQHCKPFRKPYSTVIARFDPSELQNPRDKWIDQNEATARLLRSRLGHLSSSGLDPKDKQTHSMLAHIGGQVVPKG